MAAKMAQKITKIRLPPLPTINDIIRLYKLRAIKQLSQNFLMDERLMDRIVRAAGNIEGSHVCEVGPGPGGITRSILRRSPSQVVLVEKDPRFMASLEMLAESTNEMTNFSIIQGDILKTDLGNVFSNVAAEPWDGARPPVHLIGNLPFSISTILVIRWLEDISKRRGAWKYGRTRMTLTFQKEVAERMAAPILSQQRCRLSVMCQNWCRVIHKFTISGKAFIPKPDVDVGVVSLTPLKHPVITLDFKLVEKVIRQIFSMRQKYSIRGAMTLFPPNLRDTLPYKMYEMADIDPETRPFQLDIHEFNKLCIAYNQIITDIPQLATYTYNQPKYMDGQFTDIDLDCI